MRVRRDEKEKNKMKETDAKRMGRDDKREERTKKTGERQKIIRVDEIIKGRREEEAREIGGTQNLRPEKRLKLSGEFREQGN